MSYKKVARLVELLIKQTRAGKVSWERTSEPEEFQASFSEYSIRLIYREDSNGPAYIVRVFDWAGDVIEEVSDYEIRNFISGVSSQMKDMYEVARRKVMGVEDALDSLIDQLDDDPF